MDDSNYDIEEIYCDEADRIDDYDGNDRKKVRYLQKYKKEWESEEKFRDWLEPIQNDPYAAYCNVCCSSLTARKKDLMDHVYTRKHKKNLVYKQNNPTLYQKMMQNIREVDAHVVMDKSSPWTDDAIQCLIKQVEAQHDRFYDTQFKKSSLFAMISNEMNRSGFPCVPSECQRKWESLRKSYERVLQYQVKGEFKSKFPYFNMIHRFMAKEIDPLGMREKMLCQKLGRQYNPNDPLILDGSLDGTAYTTTLITKREPIHDSSTAEIIISSIDMNAESPDHMSLDVQEDMDFKTNVVHEVGSSHAAHHIVSQVQEDDYEHQQPSRDWEESAVVVLLQVMHGTDFSVDMMGPKGRFHDAFWETVSLELKDRYCEVTPYECRLKWRALLSKYKEMFEQFQQLQKQPRPKGRPRRKPFWQHYDAVALILEKIHAAKRGLSGKRKRDEPFKKYKGKKSSRSGIEAALMKTGMIKEEQMDIVEEDEDDRLDTSDPTDVPGVSNPVDSPSKVRQMQGTLQQLTQRIDMLEREVAKKQSRDNDFESQVLGLLGGILEELRNRRKPVEDNDNTSETPRTDFTNKLSLARDGKMQVTLADGTISVHAEPYLHK